MRLPPVHIFFFLFKNFCLDGSQKRSSFDSLSYLYIYIENEINQKRLIVCYADVFGKENIGKGIFLGKVKVFGYIATVQLLVKIFLFIRDFFY